MRKKDLMSTTQAKRCLNFSKTRDCLFGNVFIIKPGWIGTILNKISPEHYLVHSYNLLSVPYLLNSTNKLNTYNCWYSEPLFKITDDNLHIVDFEFYGIYSIDYLTERILFSDIEKLDCTFDESHFQYFICGFSEDELADHNDLRNLIKDNIDFYKYRSLLTSEDIDLKSLYLMRSNAEQSTIYIFACSGVGIVLYNQIDDYHYYVDVNDFISRDSWIINSVIDIRRFENRFCYKFYDLDLFSTDNNNKVSKYDDLLKNYLNSKKESIKTIYMTNFNSIEDYENEIKKQEKEYDEEYKEKLKTYQKVQEFIQNKQKTEHDLYEKRYKEISKELGDTNPAFYKNINNIKNVYKELIKRYRYEIDFEFLNENYRPEL